jgi:hypothetical protein
VSSGTRGSRIRRKASRPRTPGSARAASPAQPAARGGRGQHELRNCLAVIANAVYYLKLVAPPDDRVRKYLTILEREVRTAKRLVDPPAGELPELIGQSGSGSGAGA